MFRWQVDEGGGAFYGPKIDLKIRDAIGRTWQCSTVQADFNLPDRFNLEYIDRLECSPSSHGAYFIVGVFRGNVSRRAY